MGGDESGFKNSRSHQNSSPKLSPRALIVKLMNNDWVYLAFTQFLMLAIFCIFVIAGCSLHMVKLSRLRGGDYQTVFKLNESSLNDLSRDLDDVKDSVGAISFFKILRQTGSDELQDDSRDFDFVACGGTHKGSMDWSIESKVLVESIFSRTLGGNYFSRYVRRLVFAIDNPKNNEGANYLMDLFIMSGGYVSPCYLFVSRLYVYFVGPGAGLLSHFIVLLPWIHVCASPHPIILVHLPRLIFYVILAFFRYVVLYLGANKAEKYFFLSSFDFSDHVILYCLFILILSVEWCAVGMSKVHPIVVILTRGYCLSIFAIVVYSAFFTTVFFHSAIEILFGFIIGITGLFISFWISVLFGFLSLSNIGIWSKKDTGNTFPVLNHNYSKHID